MSGNHRFPLLRPMLVGAAMSLLGAQAPAFATPDLTIPAVVCVPGDRPTMENGIKLALTGVVRRLPGRDPPPHLYFCPVFNPDFTSAQPDWRHLRLMYQDNTAAAGNVVVRLYAKSRGRLITDPPQGSTAKIGSVSSVPAVGVNLVSAPLPIALDFQRFSYYLTLEMVNPFTSPGSVVDTHEVRLSD